MKIILSRKGFDSSYGGCPSPIFPNDRLLSLPIPAKNAPSRFSDLVYDEHQIGELVTSLSQRRIDAASPTHLDPDLHADLMKRCPGWRPAFGQTGVAQSHLARNKVGPGDLFLFFGWFRRVIGTPIGWQFEPGSPDLHVIFGWLQVGEVLNVGDDTIKFMETHPWLRNHPHLHGERSPNNTIYVASEALTLPNGPTKHAGGGTFGKLKRALILTASNQRNRSLWTLPSFFFPGEKPPLSYHKSPSRWIRGEDGQLHLKSVAKGQEFILDTAHYPEAVAWAGGLIHGEGA